MKGFLIDTNVPSELTREKPNPGVAEFLKRTDKQSMYISVMTIGEIRKGLDALPDGIKKDSLENWLKRDVRAWFSGRILPVTEAIAEDWGRLSSVVKRRGASLAVVDGLVAATAILHSLTIVTRIVKDFSNLGVEIINPWKA